MADWPAGGTGEMFKLVHQLPEQLRAAAQLEGLASLQAPDGGFDRVLLCGMGGSAIAGDLVQPLLQHQPVALDVHRDYDLPHWVDSRTLILAASYSGNTEESLSALAEARRRGCPVIGITSGGQLAAAAAGEGGEPFPRVSLPGGLPPRASLGYGLGALVHVLGRLGLVEEAAEQVAEAADVLAGLNAARLAPFGSPPQGEATPEDPAGMASAAAVAADLQGRVPVLYTVGLSARGVGVRFKGQLNENSKVPACLAVFPELNHNDLVGWELAETDRGRFVLLVIGEPQANERLEARIEVTRNLLAVDLPVVHRLLPTGRGALARVLSLVQFGDYVSCHLAALKGVDAVPVTRIQQLKDHLARL